MCRIVWFNRNWDATMRRWTVAAAPGLPGLGWSAPRASASRPPARYWHDPMMAEGVVVNVRSV